MLHTKILLFYFIIVPFISFSQTTHVVISEFATRGANSATDEFVELYNPTNAPIDLSSWKLEYKSATGTTWSPRANIPTGKSIPAKGFFLIAPTSYQGSVTADYIPSEWTAGMADNGHLQIVNSLGTTQDKVGWGSAIDPEGCAAPNHGTSANNNSVERKAKSTSASDSLCGTGAHSLLGNGQDTEQNCNDFVARMCGRLPQNTSSPTEPALCDGSGATVVSPTSLQGGQQTIIIVKYKRAASQTISDLRIILPNSFSWSHSINDISYTNITATVSVTEDSILLEGITFAADSTEITISNIAAPDSTGSYPVRVQSRCTAFRDVAPIRTILVFGTPIPIGNVKQVDSVGNPVMLNQFVTIRGVVTVGNEFCSPSHIQDNTGAIAVYGTITSDSINIGDDVVLTGKVTNFNGLTELVELTLNQIVSQGNTVEPVLVTTQEINESYEGMLVKILGVVVRDTFGNPITTWDCGTSGRNYRLIDASGFTQIRADNCINICGTPAPQDEFDVIGVIGQFDVSPPFFSGYQLMPRSDADIKSCGPSFSSVPIESDLQQTSLKISWTTKRNSSSFVKYGLTTDYELGIAGDATPTRNHAVVISGLSAATIYNVVAFSDSSSDTCYSQNLVVSTTSPSSSTGQMNVYFNKSVYTPLALQEPAQGNVNFVQKIINRINGAKRSVDLCLYSLSGANEGEFVATALVAAKNNRGVKVRVVAEADNRNSNAFQLLEQNGIPLIDDTFGNNNGAELMHNKFIIIDARGGAPESTWLWTGSWNITQQGTQSDMQNVFEIQDMSLANAYTREFEEMWGSTTDIPNSTYSRFGVRKLNNTPHKFLVNGSEIEVYFSPTDKASSQFVRFIKSATYDFEFNIYTFTRTEIADAIIYLKNSGKQVRGVMDNNSDLGTQYTRLTTAGIDVKLKTGVGGLLHHKLAIKNALDTAAQQWVWTGSMNWSNSGEGSNNENSIAIQNNRIANFYLQEFAARYYDFGGTDTLRFKHIVNVPEHPLAPNSFSLLQNYPNPFNPTTTIAYSLEHPSYVTLKLYNVLGKEIQTLVDASKDAGEYLLHFNAGNLPSGMYFYRMVVGNNETKKGNAITKTMFIVK